MTDIEFLHLQIIALTNIINKFAIATICSLVFELLVCISLSSITLHLFYIVYVYIISTT